MPETRSDGATTGLKRQHQSLSNVSQKKVKPTSVQAVYTEEDFLIENYRDWGLSGDDLRRIKEFTVGEPVEPAEFTDSELKAAGYSSWKQYEVCGALRAW